MVIIHSAVDKDDQNIVWSTLLEIQTLLQDMFNWSGEKIYEKW